MLYQQSLEIHERIETILTLIETGCYSTPTLAEKVGVSIPTVSRIVAALREKGHEIQAMRSGNAWRYVLVRKAVGRNQIGGKGDNQAMVFSGPND